MDTGHLILGLGLKPKALHSLPGRVRVNVPVLKRVPPSMNHLVPMVSSLLTAPEAIQKAQASHVSGNILLHYDPKRVSERDVLNWLDGLLRVFLSHRDRFMTLDPAQIPAAVDRLRTWLAANVGPNLNLETTLEIPEDVLA